MSTLNTERLREIPALSEEVISEFTVKLPAAGETITEIAKSTGAGQFIKDAEKFNECAKKLADMVKGAIGEEGDTLGNEGTVMAAYSAGVKVEKAMGGEL